MLSQIVYEVVEGSPQGIQHVEVVREVLRRGYKHQGDQQLSAAVYDILKELMTDGAISRRQDESLIRRYLCDRTNPLPKSPSQIQSSSSFALT